MPTTRSGGVKRAPLPEAKKTKRTKKEKAEETVENEEVAQNEGEVETTKAKGRGKKGAAKDSVEKPETESKPKGKKGAKKETENGTNADEGKDASSIYEFTVNNIKGEPVSLDKYKGHVCIIVNVASRCGHTKSNYEQFVKLHEEYGESKGLKILAFPCNQFGSQEAGDAEKICKFVDGYNVKFDMFEKINVNGNKACPLWNYLKNQIEGPNGKDIKWNFTKFIINKEGIPVERFVSATKPMTLVETLEKYW